MHLIPAATSSLALLITAHAWSAETVAQRSVIGEESWFFDAFWQTEGRLPFDLPDVSSNNPATGVNFSALVRDNVYAWGGYRLESLSPDDLPAYGGIGTQTLGLGMHMPWNLRADGAGTKPLLDWYGGVSVERMTLFDSSANDYGYGLEAGVAAPLTDRWSLSTGIHYADFGSSATRMRYGVGTHYALSSQLSVDLDYTHSVVGLGRALTDGFAPVDDDAFTLGFRYRFGERPWRQSVGNPAFR